MKKLVRIGKIIILAVAFIVVAFPFFWCLRGVVLLWVACIQEGSPSLLRLVCLYSRYAPPQSSRPPHVYKVVSEPPVSGSSYVP